MFVRITADSTPRPNSLRDLGMTDYAAQMVSFSESPEAEASSGGPFALSGGLNPMQGIFFSCATDAAEGFDDAELLEPQ